MWFAKNSPVSIQLFHVISRILLRREWTLQRRRKSGGGILRWTAVQTDEQGKEGTAAAGRAAGYVCRSAKAGENLMSYTLMHIRAKENPVLDSGTCLVLNVERRLVTLVGNQCVLAQSQFSRSAFRLLVLLVKFHDGCYYAELFACLFCPEAIFQRVMRASAEDASKLLAPYTAHWRDRLADLRRKSGPRGRTRRTSTSTNLSAFATWFVIRTASMRFSRSRALDSA